MERLVDKSLLFIIGIWMLADSREWVNPVAISLMMLACTAAAEYVQRARLREVWNLLSMVVCLFIPEGVCYLPLVWYDKVWDIGQIQDVMAEEKSGKQVCIRLGAGGALGLVLWVRGVLLLHWGARSIVIGILSGLVAVILASRTRQLLSGREKLIHLRDESTEVTNGLKMRQRELMKRQDYEIHLATLRERNRIAREIHDNVGHMLTRSILQVGALEVAYRDKPVSGQLQEVNSTLNEAMNSIRSSVRDLHDESLDLEQSVKDILKELSKHFSVRLDYDLPAMIPRNVKYCLLAITKEAVSNINHHCNGDRVDIVYREHPAFWQLAIDDNGTDFHSGGNSGIGLLNMEERVEVLNGQIHFSTKRGFGIMVMIPK